MCENADVQFAELEKQHGSFGAFAKDKGIQMANGEYVAFWDDDNFYYPHAAATLFAAAVNFDIGVVRTSHRCKATGEFITIPREWANRFLFQDIDTMCVCVRKNLAASEKWGNKDTSKGTDYRWLNRLSLANPKMNFVPVVIGSHC